MSDARDIPTDGPAGDDALAAELSLGLLIGDDLAQAQRRARIDPVFAAKVLDWDIRLSAMSDDIAPVTPPKDMFKRITNEAYPDSPKGIWRSLGIIPAFIGAGAAALVLMVALQFGGLQQPADFAPTLQARIAAEDNSTIILAAFVPQTDTLVVEWDVGTRLPDRDVELWLISGQDAPVSLGVLNQESAITELIVPPALQAALALGVLAVSDEPLGGSPTGVPTGAVLAAGEITTL